MKDVKTKEKEIELWRDLRQENFRHWRAWGSWFSWGSPVGLGLFFISLALCYWVVLNAS